MEERPEIRLMRAYGLDASNGDAPASQEVATSAGEEPPPDVFAPEPPPEQVTDIDRRYLDLLARVIDIHGLRSIPPPTPLVEGYLNLDSIAWLGGKPGHAKTFAAVGLACCVATGTPWLGNAVRQGRVLFVAAESTAGIAARIDAWVLANGGKQPLELMFLPVPAQMMQDLDVAAFRLLLKAIEPMLVILDTQARVTVGAEENSSRDMGKFVDSLEVQRRECGACILVVHHEPRNAENLRGSTALEGAATTILRLNKDGQVITLTNTKQKDAPTAPDIRLGLVPSGGSAVLSHEGVRLMDVTSESEDLILGVLRDSFETDGASATELQGAVNLARATWFRAIGSLTRKGLVRKIKVGRGTRYTLPTEEEEALL